MQNKNRINVLHFRYGFKLGGVEKFILSIIQNTVPEDNIKHHVLVFNDLYDDFLIEELKAAGCEVFIIKKQETRNPLTVFKLVKILKQYKIDVVHSHDPGGFKWISMCKPFGTSIKQVFTSHDSNIVKDLSKIDKFLLKNIVDKNAAISKSVYAEFKEVSADNTELVYNCINLSKFSEYKKEIDFHSDELKIVNVAWLMLPKKGQDILIKALALCRDRNVKFSCDFIGGRADDETYDYLNGLVQENNLTDSVRFLGAKLNINELLRNYNLFVFPSRYEGFGLVILEAMASGLPVIANSVDAPKELINHGDNGYLFKKDDSLDLADKICELYNDREKMKQIAENGFEFAQDFDISVMCKKYFEIYRQLTK